MRKLLLAAALTVVSAVAFAADVGVSVSIGQPGFYGQIDIGGYPPPQVIYQQPRMIYRGPVSQPPIYLRVPPGHAKNWSKHCRQYNACNQRVYFVRDNWYQREYAPRYQQRHDGGRQEQRNDYRNYDRDHDDRRGNDRNNKGNQEGRGHGNNR